MRAYLRVQRERACVRRDKSVSCGGPEVSEHGSWGSGGEEPWAMRALWERVSGSLEVRT